MTCISKYICGFVVCFEAFCHEQLLSHDSKQSRRQRSESRVLLIAALPAQDSLLFDELAALSVRVTSHFDAVAASLRTNTGNF